MKTKYIVLIVLVCVIAFALIGYTRGGSKGDSQDVQKIAVELGTLKKEVESLKAGLKTLKLGNKDYVKEMQEMMEKQAQPQVQSGSGGAELQQSGAGLKVAVVSVQGVFQGCERGAKYRKEAIAEQDRVIAELEELSKEIEAERAGLRTLKENSSDYMASAKELFGKQANYEARQEFYKQQMELKDQLWTKELYQDIIRIAGEIAEEKGLDLVFREDEIDFSRASVAELRLAMSSQRLLYSGGCPDITGEVIVRLDAEE